MFFTNVFFMFFIIGYKTCFLMFFILTSMFFTTMLSTDARHTVAAGFIASHVDYCSAVPYGVNAPSRCRLQMLSFDRWCQQKY